MNRILSLLLVTLIAGQASASVYFEIVDVPKVYVTSGKDANFSVQIQNGGSESTYAGLKFRNMSEGISIVGPRCTKWIDSGTTKEFDCQLKVVAGDVPPGRYSFEVGIVATGAPPNWQTVEVVVSEDESSLGEVSRPISAPEPVEEEYPSCPIKRDVGGEEPIDEESQLSGFGMILGAVGLLGALFVARRVRT